MSDAREKARAKAARLSARAQDATAAPRRSDPTAGAQDGAEGRDGPPAGSGTSARRAAPRAVVERSAMVRTTVDLAPAMHRELRALLGEVADELGRTRITASDAHRVLVRRLLRDSEAREQFLDDCRDQL